MIDGRHEEEISVQLDFIFSASMAFVLAGWAALAIAPVNRSYCLAFARGVALVIALTYVWQISFNTMSVPGGDFMSLGGITALFSAPANVMLGWTHYLAFDLFIGSWELEDSARLGIPHWLLIPCLALTLVVGPIGLLVYYIVREIWKRAKAA